MGDIRLGVFGGLIRWIFGILIVRGGGFCFWFVCDVLCGKGEREGLFVLLVGGVGYVGSVWFGGGF